MTDRLIDETVGCWKGYLPLMEGTEGTEATDHRE